VPGPVPLDQLAESYLETRWHVDPVEGSGAGRSASDARLGTFHQDAVRQYIAALRAIAGAVEELDVASLDDEIDRTALLNDIRVSEHRFRVERPQCRDPGVWVGHVLEGLYQLLVLRGREPAWLARAAAGRLAAVPGCLDDARQTLDACPLPLVRGAQEALRAGVDLIGDLETAFAGMVEAPEAFRADAEAARAALDAFGAHLAGLAADGGPEEPWGIGREAFEFRLRYQHTLAASTEELLRYAARVIDETERELDVLGRALGAARWPDALERLRADAPAGSLVAVYEAEVRRASDHVRTHGLAAVPEGRLEVLATPPHARPWIPIAAYLPPGVLSQDRTGRFFVTPPSDEGPGGRSRHEIATAVAHEGYPGHHLHFLTAHAQPRVVRQLLTAPIAVEGWALYAEQLMDETGFHAEPAGRFFNRLALLWRALRIPLDIGLHTGSLTFDAAVRFLADRLHVPVQQAEAEVRRTYAEPAYQLAYAAGRRELLALRDTYRRRAGADFTLGAFHGAVLRYGALPISLVRWGLGVDA
jgi:uncharacterized protein (DUF885 family)